MRRLGVHTSIAGGLHLSIERAHALGCNTVQIFSHNPRGWSLRNLSEEEITLFRSLRQKFDISPLYIHASYLINMASDDPILRKKSIEMLVKEMDRADAIGADFVILHIGSASGSDDRVSRKRSIAALNEVVRTGAWKSGLLIENTAGERGDISSRICDLAEICHDVQGSLISGICFDTCHAFAAGYDMRSRKLVENISDELRHYMVLDKTRLIHLNDSKGDIGSHLDRHEHIGLGRIGVSGLRHLVNHKFFRDIPLILETPKKRESDDPMNLLKVRKMIR